MAGRRGRRVDEDRVPQRGWPVVVALLLIALGAWGALIPFLGPYFDFAVSPDEPWRWTAARGWLSVLPGAVTVVGGLILLSSGRRGGAALGAWLAVAAGTWLAIGSVLADPLGIGPIGTPTADSAVMRAVEQLTYHELLGVVIVFLAAIILGRHGGSPAMIAGPETAAGTSARPTPAPARPGRDRHAVVIDEREERLVTTRGGHPAATVEPAQRQPRAAATAEGAADDVPDRHGPTRSGPVYGPITADQAYRTGGHEGGRCDR